MRRIVTIDKKSGKKKLVNVPSYDQIVVNNQMGQPAYDVGISSNGDGLPAPLLFLSPENYVGSGTIWPDVSGNGYDATLYNSPIYNTDYFNFSDTGTQYADLANLGDLPQWTFDIWFRVTANLNTKEATAVLTTVYDDGINYGTINFCLASDISAGAYNSKLAVGFFDGAWHQNVGFTPTLNTWYNVVGTYDGSTINQYINGILNDSLSYSGTSSSNGAPVRIARRWDGPLNTIHFFPGDVGIVKVYNESLNVDQVNTLFQENRTTYGI